MRLGRRLSKVEAKLGICPGCGRRGVDRTVIVRHVDDGEPDPQLPPEPAGCDHRLLIIVRRVAHPGGYLSDAPPQPARPTRPRLTLWSTVIGAACRLNL